MAKTARESQKLWTLKNPNYWKEYHAIHKGKKTRYDKEWIKKHEGYWKNRQLFARYGLTKEQYNDIFINQAGKCAICGRHQGAFKRAFAIDHNHITGKIRGLLCVNCNTILGHAKDDIGMLENAIKYLEKH